MYEIVEYRDRRWVSLGRPGPIGRRRRQIACSLDHVFGEGGWCFAWIVGGDMVDQLAALQLYEDAYVAHFEAQPEVLSWLVTTASDVWDVDPVLDVESGEDWGRQQSDAIHLQDIAIRRAVRVLTNRGFQGDRLVRVRSRRSEGSCLSPFVVPFHRPDLIRKHPATNGSWSAGSIEDFYQSNRRLLVEAERFWEVRDDTTPWYPPRRDTICPCGSGLTYGKCCRKLRRKSFSAAKALRRQLADAGKPKSHS